MADNDIRVKISAKDEASATLAELVKRMKAAGLPTKGLSRDLAGLNRETNSLSRFSRGFTLPRLTSGLRGMRREAAEMRKGLTRLGEGMGSLGELGEIGGIGAAIAGAGLLTKHWANVGMTTSIAARNIGITTGQLYRYQRAASLAGVSGDAATQALQGFASNIWASHTNQNPAMENALRTLGIHAGFLSGKLQPLPVILAEVADKIKAIHSGPGQLRVAEMLGLGPLLPFLRQGGAKIRAEMGELKREGVGENFGGARALYRDFSRLDTAVMRAGNELAKQFAPAVGQATTALTSIVGLAASKNTLLNTAIGRNWFTNWLQKHNLPKELGIKVPWAGLKPAPGLVGVRLPSQTRPLRDNNPLNLSYIRGQVGLAGRDGQFGRYRSMPYGIAASVNQLLIDRSRGLDTVRGIYSSWDRNDPKIASKINNIARWMHVKPDQRLNLRNPKVMGSLVDAMARQEGSGKLSASDTMAGVQMGYGEFARGMARGAPALPESVRSVVDSLRKGNPVGRVTIDINHNNVPPGVSVKAHSTDSTVVMGGLRISRAMTGDALP